MTSDNDNVIEFRPRRSDPIRDAAEVEANVQMAAAHHFYEEFWPMYVEADIQQEGMMALLTLNQIMQHCYHNGHLDVGYEKGSLFLAMGEELRQVIRADMIELFNAANESFERD